MNATIQSFTITQEGECDETVLQAAVASFASVLATVSRSEVPPLVALLKYV